MLIENISDSTFTSDIPAMVEKSLLFKDIKTYNQVHPVFLLVHHLIPTELTFLFYHYTGKQKLRSTIFISFIEPFIKELNEVIVFLIG